VDYIDRDSYFCGLGHRVDQAIFRRYSVVPGGSHSASGRHIASRLFGTHGIRLDAEFAIESLFLERYALFLKVYTHPAKIAAGAMLGKAIIHAISGKKPEFDEHRLEWMGDDALLNQLVESKKASCKKIAEQIRFRELFKTAFRASVLEAGERHHDQYTMRQESLRKAGLLDADSRTSKEEELAKTAGIDPLEVVLYCSRPPGLQKIEQYVEQRPGDAERRDEVHRPYLRTYERHLGLWTAYVFTSVSPKKPEFGRLGEAAERIFGLKNQLAISRHQGVLF
jgi:HD superfamily phosphohydrolase